MTEHDNTPNTTPTIKNNTYLKIGIVVILLLAGYILSLFTPILALGVIMLFLGGLGYIAFKIWKDLNDHVNKIGQNKDDE